MRSIGAYVFPQHKYASLKPIWRTQVFTYFLFVARFQQSECTFIINTLYRLSSFSLEENMLPFASHWLIDNISILCCALMRFGFKCVHDKANERFLWQRHSFRHMQTCMHPSVFSWRNTYNAIVYFSIQCNLMQAYARIRAPKFIYALDCGCKHVGIIYIRRVLYVANVFVYLLIHFQIINKN